MIPLYAAGQVNLSALLDLQGKLPNCSNTGFKHNCVGLGGYSGGIYFGEWRDGQPHGLGKFNDRGTDSVGIWSYGFLSETVNLNDYEQLIRERQERERLQSQPVIQTQQRPQQVLSRNERRIALVIGNSAYKISPLDNPSNDASDIADVLKRTGFNTTLIRNATLSQMREATRRFADLLPNSDVALIYFAGHGVELRGKNYMIPVNADIKFEYELEDQSYDAAAWLSMLETVKSNNADRVNIVILDACRNNSLITSRNLGRGLGKMDAPSGTFLAYSTAPGKVAADGARGDRNSPFTKHLLKAIWQPGLPIEELFKEVRRNVSRETNGAQVPWESTSLMGYFAFR